MTDGGPDTVSPADPGTRLLVEALHGELLGLARRERRRLGGSETLRTTALVNEAYLKLFQSGHWKDRGHFLNTAAMAMRQVLVSHARKRLTAKRGEGGNPLPLEEGLDVPADDTPPEDDERMVALDDALGRLERDHPRLARVVECRWFAGYTEAETAAILGVNERTIKRDWVKAKALLYEAMGSPDETDPS